MAVVGGLVLSLSATAVKNDQTIQPHLLFHISRIVSFFVLGGAIGVVGSAFVLGQKGTFVMSLVVGIVMLIMGLNLLEVFHGLKKIQPAMPKWLSKKAFGAAKINHSLTPMLAGMATFFLPCGFTQSMQIYSLSTGNFIQGALTMFFFSLGTLPVLSLVSAS
jgi:sulfite exporter TauE/SafE